MADDRIINICFHGIGTPGRELEPGEAPYWVATDAFHRMLDELATWPAVRISFDDGNASDADIALPALVERDLDADFFVLAGRFDRAGSLSSDGVRELHKHGMRVGTHGMRHRSWRGLDAAAEREELVAARERIAALTGTVDEAACPLGRYDRTLLSSMRRLGYRRVFTSDRRPARRDAWLQPRFSVRSDDTVPTLRATALTAPPLKSRIRNAAVGFAKRWR